MKTELDGAVPVSLSDLPTVAVRLDPERTLPMEPVVLAQLCAQTQVSQRRRILPMGLEYSVHVEFAADPPVALIPAASSSPAPEPRRTHLLQLLALLLGPLLGLGGGAGVAWQLSRQATRPRADRAARQLRPPPPLAALPLAAPQPVQPPTALPALPALPDPPSGSPPSLLPPRTESARPAAAGRPLLRGLPGTPQLAPPLLPNPVAAAGSPPGSSRPPTAAASEPTRPLMTSSPGESPHAAAPQRTAASLVPARLSEPAAATPNRASAPPPLSRPRPLMLSQLYRREMLSGSHRLCVNPSGAVAAVPPLAQIPSDDEILRTLRAGHFPSHAAALCIDQELHFKADE